MTAPRTSPANRRQLLAAMGGSGLALALAASPSRLLAQDTPDYSDHPLTGMWLAMANPALPENPQFPASSLFDANGDVFLSFPPIDVGADGPVIQSSPLGVWEPYDDQTGHFTVVQTMSALDGTFVGSVTIDGYPSVQPDGMTFIDRIDLTHVTIRDANGAIVAEPPPDATGRPVTGMRMAVGAAGFPGADAAPPEGTPAS